MSESDNILETNDLETTKIPSSSVIRVARDGSSVIVKSDNLFKVIDITSGESFVESKRLDVLTASGSWRKALPSEYELSSHLISQEEIDIEVINHPQYKVPQQVKESITAAIETNKANINLQDLKIIHEFTENEKVSLEAVEWVHNFFNITEGPEQLHGGFAGKKWAAKILKPVDNSEEVITDTSSEVDPYENFDDDTFIYLGVGKDLNNGTVISDLFCIDPVTSAVYKWELGAFVLQDNLLADEFEADSIIILDAETAQAVAKWIDAADSTPTLDVLDLDPEERNLFTLAYDDLDFEELDRTFNIIADASGYTPVERSINAKRQHRGPGGRFGGSQVAQTKKLRFQKASLPVTLPLVADVNQVINDWLAQAENLDGPSGPNVAPPTAPATTAAGVPIEFDNAQPVQPAQPAEAQPAPAAPAPAEQPAQTEPAKPAGNVIYFAIVDPVDQHAVLDVVALIKQNDQPTAWVRTGGAWVKADDKLSDLQGATPPPVVQLDAPEPVTNVINQVDNHDVQKPADTSNVPIAASGFELVQEFDDPFDTAEIVEAVFSLASEEESDSVLITRNKLRNRARTINRMDLIPVEWREATLAEIGIVEHSTSPLYGEFGEIIPAITELTDYSKAQRENDSEKGFAMPSGAYPIRTVKDLKNAIQAFGRAKESEKAAVKRHIIKRAKALGHTDLIPENWSMTASGVPGVADTPGDFKATERLMNYWAFGKGTLKWLPGTPGDLTRLQRHLVKFVGPERSWSLAQNIHKRRFGVSNIKHDKATGQYKGH